METNELRNIWQTLADENLIEKELARENILQLLSKKGAGIIQNLTSKIRKEIVLDIITSFLTLAIFIGVMIWQGFDEFRYHFILVVIFGYFVFKLTRDISKYQMLQSTRLTDSIKTSTLDSYKRFKKRVKYDTIIAVSFIIPVNLYVIYIYYKVFGNYKEIDFSSMNTMAFGFVLMMILVGFVIVVPFVIKHFYKKKFKNVITQFEDTLKEFEEEEQGQGLDLG